MSIHRGDIYYIDNAKYIGFNMENTPSRPAVIVSNDKCNAHANDVTVVYLSAHDSRPDMPTHVPVICKQQSTALCETVSQCNVSRIGNYVRTCTDAEMQAIEKALMIQLGIEKSPGANEVRSVIPPVVKDDKPDIKLTPVEMQALIDAQDENIRLKAEIEVYKGLIGKLIPQLA